jgi:DNA polymerase
MLATIALTRDEVYIANVIKCRPPGNRDPQADEIANCRGWLEAQMDIIRPRLICSMGNVATKTLLATQTGIMRLRGTLHTYRGIPLVPTYHPSFLLRESPDTLERKREAWKDLLYMQRLLDETADP